MSKNIKSKLKKHKLYLFAVGLTTLSLAQAINAGEDKSVDESIYSKIDYEYVFDQTKILSKYKGILEKEGLETELDNSKKDYMRKESSCTKEMKDCGAGIMRKGIECSDSCNSLLFKIASVAYKKCKDFCCKKNNQNHDYSELPISESFAQSCDNDEEKNPSDLEKGLKELPEELENKTFLEAEKKLDKELLQDYRAKKKLTMLNRLAEPCFDYGVFGTAFGLSAAFCKESFGFSAGIFTGILARGLHEFTRAFCNICGCEPNDSLKYYEELYATKKRFFHPTLQKSIEQHFRLGRESVNGLGNVLAYLDIVVNLPLKSKQVKNPQEYKAKLEKLLDCYDQDVKKSIETSIQGHYNRYSNLAKPNNRQKIILYLQGPAGLGKTYTAETIAKLMGLPLISLDGAENIIGCKDNPGKLLETICSPDTPRNAIIFIDEANHLIGEGKDLAAIKSLLEPSKGYYQSPYLNNAKVDISHFFFILAGNSEIKVDKEKDKGALLSRFKTIHINKMKENSKITIILDKVNALVDKDQEKDLLEKLSKLIILRTAENENPGVREIITECNEKIDSWRAIGGSDNKDSIVWEKEIEEAKKKHAEKIKIEESDKKEKQEEEEIDKELKKLEKKKEIEEKRLKLESLRKKYDSPQQCSQNTTIISESIGKSFEAKKND